jgi:hypothetical protein
MAAPAALGNLLPNQSVVFRAFKAAYFLNDSKTALVDRAYFCHKNKDEDGLSLGTTAENAVMMLPNKNHGVSSLPVSGIHGLNRGLEVRDDPDFAGHVLVKGMPLYEDDEKLASDIGWELVTISAIIHDKPYYPVGHPRYRQPQP